MSGSEIELISLLQPKCILLQNRIRLYLPELHSLLIFFLLAFHSVFDHHAELTRNNRVISLIGIDYMPKTPTWQLSKIYCANLSKILYLSTLKKLSVSE